MLVEHICNNDYRYDSGGVCDMESAVDDNMDKEVEVWYMSDATVYTQPLECSVGNPPP